MKPTIAANRGFTLVELLIVVVVLAVLASIGVATYANVQKRAANAAVYNDLRNASEQLGLSYVKSPQAFSALDEITGDMQTSDGVILRFATGYTGPRYDNLTAVQEGVLFYDICENLILNPSYSEIHSADGTQTQSVVMRCDDSIADDQLLITGWDSKTWKTPVTKQALQDYISSVPYDDWWTDKQAVVRGFYGELIQRFELSGGVFPVDSFWDPWANQWSGVPKEDLPAPTPPSASAGGAFCVEGYHVMFPESIYKITQKDKIESGPC